MVKITYEKAVEVWKDRSNGADLGHSTGKGGRAWLEGEFQLCELEALCVILRHEAGELAEGLPELMRNMRPVSASARQREVLARLLEDDEAECYSPLTNIAIDLRLTKNDVRIAARALVRNGLAKRVAWHDDEGYIRGSGYGITEFGKSFLRQIGGDA